MHITIFGVGRSGTKAVQLYLSYLMAQREKEVWINYEPYFWMDRFTKQINFEGYYQHSHSPHIIRSQQDLTKGHLNFLKKLSVPGKNATTKFIRGNGRMNAINQVIQPDHSIVIIRDLYQVLVSVLKTEWDFWSVGFQFTQSWESFVAEIRKSKIIDNFDWCLDQISDRLDQNAFYWYAMNKAVLQSRWADAYYINYANINRVEEIARILIDPNVKENINDMLFTGDYIHENFPLQSVSRSTTLSDKFNNLLYQTKFM
ncbi:MAG: hypothetical protein KA444_08785, partial [Bacteroidia bacterium]|nr:hypothetical protein [Bacteroidia bacterium]